MSRIINSKSLANLKPGRPPSGRSARNVRLDDDIWVAIDRLCQQQNWKTSYCIEILVRKSLEKHEINGYDLDELTLIIKGESIEK
jgi:hypothetical protein